MANIVTRPPRGALQVLPNTDRYKCRFDIPSQSSGRIYRVSFDAAGPYWVCSCPGNIRHGQCKHLDAMGVHGRKYGKDDPDNRKTLVHFQAA